MEQATCKRVATVRFWDGYARWYKLWMEHTQYHQRIIEVLRTMTKPGWKVMDIGAGNGILSIPLHIGGCDVTALEPSISMRNLLYEEAFKKRIDEITVDERIWEEVPCFEYLDYDLILACNTLHLTQIGFDEALAKVFRAGPANVLLVSEAGPPDVRVKWHYENYAPVFMKSYEVESSYAYHHFNEMVEHWAFKKGRGLQPDEIDALKERLVLEAGHLWMKDTAQVMMCWWKRDGQK
ncbi:MAG TPA: methyltransferase domain-containing protein [Thermodesulfobacteriota bacterium]|nr:methyltransferase domain-containing protein [Thermodesulfobacteriota bacterium]